MKFKEKHEGEGPEIFIFDCSGRSLSVFMSVVGINDKGDTYTGFDDGLRVDAPYPDSKLTPGERQELAQVMIDRWKKYGRDETG